MTSGSHADWLPAGDKPASPGEAVTGGLSSGEPQLVSGRARVESDGLEAAQGEAEQPPAASGRVLSEDEIAAAGLFQERVLEVSETREEAVVEKRVVVREEVVLRKDVATHVETISDSVRRTEVEVDELAPPVAPDPRTDPRE
jgi:hypothetical protein